MTWSIRYLAEFTACRRAASAVEFAILAPLFFAILFGIAIFGSYLAVVHGVQQLAAEAARRSVAGLTDSERGSLAADYVSANAGSYPLIDGAHLTVTAAASSADSKVFVVTVNYDASDMFIYALPAFVPMPAKTIVRSAAIPFGGY
ncbi:MAG: pilus assembly protein [Xanthobacteraceae bacterium]|nr:pilus assembly protein [Xanthobacteraceae bacterium]